MGIVDDELLLGVRYCRLGIEDLYNQPGRDSHEECESTGDHGVQGKQSVF